MPRIQNINVIPTYGPTNQLFFEPAPPGAFPQTPPADGQAITWDIDQSLKTPHAYAVDFSVGRELRQKLSLQVAYVGRFGRNLLTQRDLKQPLDLVDPKTGIDYFAAATRLAQLAHQGLTSSQITDAVVGPDSGFLARHAADAAVRSHGLSRSVYRIHRKPSSVRVRFVL